MAMAQVVKRRLNADDWAAAALAALGEGGLAAVAVEPIAARLGATKGSFYWHFANRDALISAALALWETAHTDGVIAMIDALPDPVTQLRTLLSTVMAAAERSRIDSSLLAAADHPLVAPVLGRVTERRIAYVAGLFEKLGFPPAAARGKGLLAYSAYLGHGQLAHATPDVLPSGADAGRYVDDVIAALIGR
jgi:AcrR family transcriptional regulator